MATDVAKLMILVEAKGTAQAKKGLDDVATGANKAGKETDKLKDKSKKQTNVMDAAWGSVTQLAAGYYLASTAINKLTGDLGKMVDAYKTNDAAMTKLNAISRATGEASGYTADQLAYMSTAMHRQSAVSQAALQDAMAVAGTFTKIGYEIFPTVIERTLDLSRAYGGDLRSTMIQVGKAVNDPIAGVSALSRVGVTFTDVQKAQIKNFVEQNKLMEAQSVILNELKVQVGGASVAYGESDAGSLDRYTESLENFNAAWGKWIVQKTQGPREFLTDYFQGSVDETEASEGRVRYLEKLISLQNKFRQGEASLLASPDTVTAFSYTDLQYSIDNALFQIEKAKKQFEVDSQLGLDAPRDYEKNKKALKAELDLTVKELEEQVQFYTDALALWEKVQSDNSKNETVTPTGPTPEEIAKQDDYLRKLKIEFDLRNDLMGVKGEDQDLQRALIQLQADEAAIRDTAWYQHKVQKEDLDAIIKAYFENRKTELEEENELLKENTRIKNENAAMDNVNKAYGSSLTGADKIVFDYNAKIQEYQDILDAVEEASGRESDAFIEAQEKLAEASVNTTEQMKDDLKGLQTELSLTDQLFQDLKSTMESAVTSYLVDTFTMLGESIGGMGQGVEDFTSLFTTMIQQMISQMGTLMMTAGLTELISGNKLGWALIAAGAGTSIAGGILSSQLASVDANGEADSISQSISYTDVALPPNLSSNFSRGLNISNNIVNNADVDVTTDTTTVDGKLVFNTVIKKTSQTIAKNYSLHRPGVKVS